MRFDQLVTAADYPGTQMIPAVNAILSLLTLKPLDKERLSHIDDFNCDEALGHRGDETDLENHFQPMRGKAGPSLLTFFAMELIAQKKDVSFVTIRRRGSNILKRLENLPTSAWHDAVIDMPKCRHQKIRYVDERIRTVCRAKCV